MSSIDITLIKIGTLIRDLEPNLDLTKFDNPKDLAAHLNSKHGTNIYQGQVYAETIKELENAICKQRFNRAMPN